MNARSNSNARFTIHRLQVAQELHQFIEDQVLPGTGIESAHFWAGFDAIVADLAPKNRALLAERDRLQTELDAWHRAHPGPITDMPAYRAFLEQIAYLVPQPAAQVTTANVDAELASQAGPQLVVPITNARYALNAANARWGSLYDALYGTDAIPETDGAQKGKGYNPVRGAKVIAFARDFLDQSAPLAAGSHHDSTGYAVVDGALQVTLKDGSVSGLKHPAQLTGYQGDAAAPKSLLFAHNGIHFDLIILKHNNTFLTAYAHNQKLLVKEDQKVRKGEKIAEMGSTDADRVKLHFEVRRQGKPVDPAKFLPAR